MKTAKVLFYLNLGLAFINLIFLCINLYIQDYGSALISGSVAALNIVAAGFLSYTHKGRYGRSIL